MVDDNVKRSDKDDIDLLELFRILWKGKWIIIFGTILFAVISVFYALSLSNIYRSDVLLVPSQTDARSIGVGSQLGSLAALAGVSSSPSASKVDLALEIIKSRDFIQRFIEKRELLPYLFAVKEWNEQSRELIFNEDWYNSTTGEWANDIDAGLVKPSTHAALKAFRSSLSISRSKDSPVITIGMMHASPYVAKTWLDWLIADINEEMRIRDFEQANTSIRYLESEIAKSNLAEVQRLLYQLMEEQIKAKMLTQIRSEYVFKVLDPAIVPEERHSPKRAVICLVITFLGGMFSVLLVLLISAFRK